MTDVGFGTILCVPATRRSRPSRADSRQERSAQPPEECRLQNDGGIRITISRWFTPDHNSVAPDGIHPDIVAALEAGEGTLGLLLQDTLLYQELVATNKLVQDLLEDFQRNPRKYINLRVF